ncbi:MAG: glycosyltransferase [Bacteroidota bacterium]|nr:glycosyltransferase [Bacteroidota bacterium]MDP4217158.1 glycosyltransferase [Bacteroidota bacterium]MDP4244426.1 glycosyltransferase [Bacteroidota bacterium]MDP4256219.1 glycosyltransferase [Bacteroidota bacterium]MDP4260366.1 glycosyltransferase [Bacteroidota bacterium]
MPGKSNDPRTIRLCIFSPENNAWSETFIQNHIARLPFQSTILNGTGLANLSYNNQPILPPTRFNRIRNKLLSGAQRRGHRLEQRALRSFLKRHGIQVVLAEYGHIATIIRPACEELKIPLVVHFHGNDASHRPTLELLQKEYADLFAYASSIVSVSHAMTNRLLRLGAPETRIVYNCYGIDTALFRLSEEKAEPPTFVAVGRFVEKKAPHLSILAFAMAREQQPSIRLIMIGGGPLLEPCRQLVRGLGLEEGIEFAGIKTPAEVSSVISKARAFIQHSVIAADGNAEGTPLSILEAGACGVPVISTRHEGIRDVVMENETGLLVDEFDIKGMAGAMVRLAADPGEACRMGRAARERIETHYTLDQHIGTLTKVILDAYRSAPDCP